MWGSRVSGQLPTSQKYNIRMPPRIVTTLAVVLALTATNACAQTPSVAEASEKAKTENGKLVESPKNFLNKNELEFYLRHLYVWQDHIQVEVGEYVETDVAGLLRVTVRASYQMASQEKTFYVTTDGSQVLEGSFYEVDQNPFAKNIEKIDTLDAPSQGEDGASVVVVVYSDFQCPYCAKEAKLMSEQILPKYKDKVKLYFRDYPLNIHAWAKPAAIAGRCVYMQEPEKFWDYHDWVFANQATISPETANTKISEWVAQNGLDALKFSGCQSGPDAARKVEASMEEARKLAVSSTPTLFINGRRVSGSAPPEQIMAIINYELGYQEITHNAGDDCGCEIELPFPEAESENALPSKP